MELELIPDDAEIIEVEALDEDELTELGYDPKNSADRLPIGERFFLIDLEAEAERRAEAAERSGVPKHALDWIEVFVAT